MKKSILFLTAVLLFSSCSFRYYIGMPKQEFAEKSYNSGLPIIQTYPNTWVYKQKGETDTFIFTNDSLSGVYIEKR